MFLSQNGIIRKDSIEIECAGTIQEYGSLNGIKYSKNDTQIFDLRKPVFHPLVSDKKEEKSKLKFIIFVA